MAGFEGHLERRFSLDIHMGRGDAVCITTDASVHGFGAVLEINDTVKSFLFGTYNGTARMMLQLSDTPTSSDQQVLEGFAMLVAMREWSD